MSKKNRFLSWLIDKMVGWYNKDSYRKIKVSPEKDPPFVQIVPKPGIIEPPEQKRVIRTDPYVIEELLNDWFENDMERIIKGIRTMLHQEEPWMRNTRF